MKMDLQPLNVREPAEPTAARRVLPMWMVGLLGVLLYWGCNYTDDNGGTFNALVYRPYLSTNQLNDFRPKGQGDIVLAHGEKVFKTICSPCHMPTGSGDPTRFIPPLAGSDWVNTQGPNRIIRIVLNGLNGPITVKGQSFSGTAMLPWRDTLSDQDIAAVLTFVRSSWGNKAPPVAPEQVKKIRDATAGKGGNWTPEELQQIPESD